jgi:hypothetical protein
VGDSSELVVLPRQFFLSRWPQFVAVPIGTLNDLLQLFAELWGPKRLICLEPLRLMRLVFP